MSTLAPWRESAREAIKEWDHLSVDEQIRQGFQRAHDLAALLAEALEAGDDA